MEKFYITTPIYYVNAKPHIGHAYTTLAADCLARYYRQKLGEDKVFFLTGTDEHGAKVAEAAARAHKEPRVFCNEVADEFKEAWKILEISYNQFIRTTDVDHEKRSAEFLNTLKEKGALYEGDYVGLYCTGCENFITEPQLDENGNCPDHQKKPETITEKNWFFTLQTYLPRVEELIRNDVLRIEPGIRKREVLGLFKQGLMDFSVSRPNVQWGIPLPWDRAQTIYVWVEALLNYWTALYDTPYAPLWPPDVQLMAKDIIKFHCIFWPAMLLAYYDNDSSQLPSTIFAHGFFTVNGKKMSKTLENVIDPVTLVKEYGADAARYLIVSQFPFGNDGNIEADKFTEKYNADLANGIGNVVSRVSTLCEKKITDWDRFWELLENYVNTYKKISSTHIFNAHMEKFQLVEALLLIIQSLQTIDYVLSKEKIWERDSTQRQDEILARLVFYTGQILCITHMLKPFMPRTAQKIEHIFDVQNKKIHLGEHLFPRK